MTFPHGTNVAAPKGVVEGDTVAVTPLHKLNVLLLRSLSRQCHSWASATAFIANSVAS